MKSICFVRFLSVITRNLTLAIPITMLLGLTALVGWLGIAKLIASDFEGLAEGGLSGQFSGLVVLKSETSERAWRCEAAVSWLRRGRKSA